MSVERGMTWLPEVDHSVWKLARLVAKICRKWFATELYAPERTLDAFASTRPAGADLLSISGDLDRHPR